MVSKGANTLEILVMRNGSDRGDDILAEGLLGVGDQTVSLNALLFCCADFLVGAVVQT